MILPTKVISLCCLIIAVATAQKEASASPCDTQNPCFNGACCVENPRLKMGYECLCKPGYRGVNCKSMYSRCLNSYRTKCYQGCVVYPSGQLACTCDSGFELDEDKKACKAVVPCTSNNGAGPCTGDNVMCFKDNDLETCHCNLGYELESATSCIGQDPCSSPENHNCDSHATCTKIGGSSFTCACNTGYAGDGVTCNECKTGYMGDGQRCYDIDECTITDPALKHNCDEHATCTNNEGSYTCVCMPDYVGNGRNCNECKTGSMGYGYRCNRCKTGYMGSEQSICRDIDECTTTLPAYKHNCDEHATCMNNEGSYTCVCMPDYVGDGRKCIVKGTENMTKGTQKIAKEAKVIVDLKSPDEVAAKVDELVKQLDETTQPPAGGYTPDEKARTLNEKKFIRQEIATGVLSYVKKTYIKNLREAERIGDALDKSTNNKEEMNAISMDACLLTSIEVLKKTPKADMNSRDLKALSTAVSKGPANVIDALFDTPETIPLDKDMKKRTTSKEKQELSKDLMHKTDSLIRDMQEIFINKIDTDAALMAMETKSFGFKIGTRSKSFLQKKEVIAVGNVAASLGDGLEAERNLRISLTTFSRNPYLYGEDSQFTNTPVLTMEVKDVENQLPAPSVFSGSSAMQATIASKLKDNDQRTVKVQIEDIPERGKVHDITLDNRHGYMRVTFTKEFLGNVTLLGQMNIQPGDVDYDFKYVINDAILIKEVRQGCQIVTSQQGQDYAFFVYSSCFKQLGKLKLLFKLASGEIAPVTYTIQGRSLLAKGSYTVKIIIIQPRAWNSAASAWEIVDWIEVLPESTSSAVKFKSNSFGTITNGLFVPPNTIDFAAIFPNFLARVRDSPTVLVTILVILLIFVILLIWTRRMDRKDFNMWVCAPLVDNHPGDQYWYRINVFTSSRIGAGTSANVFIIIIGEEGATEPRSLYDGYRQNFQRGSISSFLLKNNTSLGRPQYVFVWHDGEGSESDWHLSHIIIEDLYRETCDYFLCAHWLSAVNGDRRTNRLLRVTQVDNISSISNLFRQHSKRFLFDDNIWFSMFSRPNKSRFTRVQRLCSCTGALFLMMVSNAMWFQTGTTGSSSALHIGPLRISFRSVFIGLMSSIIILPPTIAMVEIFSRTRFHRKEINVQIRRRHSERMRSRLLPWWCVVFGYFLVVVAILCGAFFTFFFSLEWGWEKSNEWLSTLLVSVADTVILLQPGKVLLIAFILTCILRLPSDADHSVEDEFLLTDVAENVNTLDIPVARSIPDLPDNLDNCQESEETKTEREVRDKKLFTIARATGIQFLYLILLMIICSSNRGSHYYQQNTALKRAFSLEENKAIIRHGHYGQLYSWLKRSIIPILYPDEGYNGQALNSYERRFIATVDGLRVGPARLRQKRVRQGFCSWNKIVKKCAGDFDPSIEETADFLVYWKKPTTATVTKSPFVYTTAHKNDIPLYAEYATFNGGGYVAELGASAKTAQLILDQLFKTNWIDRQTRAVFVEATIYNANVNLFSCLRIVIETPAVGGIFVSRTVESFRPYPYVDTWDLVLLVLQIVWILVLFYLVYVEINLARTFRWGYVSDPWTYVQLLNIVTSFASATLYVVRIVFVIKAIEDVKNHIGEYVSFDKMIEIDESYTASLAIIAFICIIQLLKPLSFNFFFAVLMNVLRKASSIFVCCFLFILALWMVFGISSHFVLVRTTASFRTFPRTIWTLLRLTIGIIKFPEAMGDPGEDVIVKRLIFVIFMLISYMVLMNLVVTIYLEMYSAIQGSKELRGFDKELNDHFWKRVLILWNAFTNKQAYAWSYDVPKTVEGATAPIQPEESYRLMHSGNIHIDHIVKISTMIHKTMGNAFKKYSSELETVKLDAKAAKAATDDLRRKWQDTAEELVATKDTVSSIKNVIDDTLMKRTETVWLRAHPEEWTRHRYYYEDGILALTVTAMPPEFSKRYLTVERIDDPDMRHLSSPDLVDIFLPVCSIKRTEDFLIEEPILVALPVHGSDVDCRRELVLKARICEDDGYKEFSADPVQVDDHGLIGLRAAFTEIPETLAVVLIWYRDHAMIGPDGGEVVSSCDNRVKVQFPREAFRTSCDVILQVKFIDIDESDECGSSHVVMLTLSERAMMPVEVTVPFNEPKSAVTAEKMKRISIRQGEGDWYDDLITPVRSAGSIVSFQIIVPHAGEVFSFFVKSGNSSLLSRSGLVEGTSKTRKTDPLTDASLPKLAEKMGSDLERFIYALDGRLHRQAARWLRKNPDMSDEEKGAFVLKQWLNNQPVSVDKLKLLREACKQINRPDLVVDLDHSAEEFRRYTEERVQDANLLKAFHVIIQSDKVVSCWRDLAARLDLSDGYVTELDRREPPLSGSEKCFEVLLNWKENGKNVTLRYLQKHLKSLGCKVAANKLADYM